MNWVTNTRLWNFIHHHMEGNIFCQSEWRTIVTGLVDHLHPFSQAMTRVMAASVANACGMHQLLQLHHPRSPLLSLVPSLVISPEKAAQFRVILWMQYVSGFTPFDWFVLRVFGYGRYMNKGRPSFVYLWLKHESYGITEVFDIELSYRYWCRPKSFLIDPVTPEELIPKERHNRCWTLQT